jgi:7,8-didemethyl-8-hydroxy-5-deazariboflavin synthase CofH subunit
MRTDIVPAELDLEFEGILERALAGEELSIEEGERLLRAEGSELRALVTVADEVRRRTVGDIVTYVVNRNLNFTNICVGSCKFCAFRRSPDAPNAYVLTPRQIQGKVREALEFGATEVCIQGGLHPNFGLDEYVSILQAVRSVSPDIHIHAFSPAELNHIAEQDGLSIDKVIEILRGAGLDSVPGTAAEILVDRVRSIICPKKISASQWVDIIKKCHNLGLPTTATILYGHVETPYEQAKHLATIREIQRETRGFTEFVPLGFMPQNTKLKREGIVLEPPSLVHSLRIHAVARLMLAGYVNNVQASWVKLGPTGAQLMLKTGANDLSGTLLEENITRAAGGGQQVMLPRELEQLILELGRIPRQRTTTYKLI